MRKRLPNRRHADLVTLEFGGREFTLHIGRRDTGEVAEIFFHSKRPGSQLDDLLSDIAVIVSLALQNGIKPDELAKSLGRSGSGRASILGQALDLLSEAGR